MEEKPESVAPAYTKGSHTRGRRDRIYSLQDSWFVSVQLFLLVSESRSIRCETKEHQRPPGFCSKIEPEAFLTISREGEIRFCSLKVPA